MKGFTDKLKEAFEKVQASFREDEQLSTPLIESENSNSRRNSRRTRETNAERSSTDAFTDLEFRQQLMREEQQVLSEIEARKYIESNDEELARTLEMSQSEIQRQRLEDVDIISRMTEEEKQFLSSLPEDLRRDAIAEKRMILMNQTTNSNATTSQNVNEAPNIPPPPFPEPSYEPNEEFRATIPQNLKPGDKFRVILPGNEPRIVTVPEGLSAGDSMIINPHEDTKLTEAEIEKIKFLLELPEDMRAELLGSDAELSRIYIKYQKNPFDLKPTNPSETNPVNQISNEGSTEDNLLDLDESSENNNTEPKKSASKQQTNNSDDPFDLLGLSESLDKVEQNQ